MRFAIIRINGKYEVKPIDEVENDEILGVVESDEASSEKLMAELNGNFNQPISPDEIPNILDRERSLWEDDGHP